MALAPFASIALSSALRILLSHANRSLVARIPCRWVVLTHPSVPYIVASVWGKVSRIRQGLCSGFQDYFSFETTVFVGSRFVSNEIESIMMAIGIEYGQDTLVLGRVWPSSTLWDDLLALLGLLHFEVFYLNLQSVIYIGKLCLVNHINILRLMSVDQKKWVGIYHLSFIIHRIWVHIHQRGVVFNRRYWEVMKGSAHG